MPFFEKVGECLYRYVPTGKYYARFEVNGRELRRSLGTTDRALAKRKLAELQRATARTTGQGDKLTLAELCDRYMATVRAQAAKTIYRKEAIARRIKDDWPGGSNVAISKVIQSQISAWLASYGFGVPSYNLHLLFIRATFDLAVADHLLADSPALGLKIKKAKKPIRKTPSFEEFRAIVADIRAMIHNAEATDSGDFVEFMGLAGLGQAEAIALTWGDIDWKNERITTFRQKTSRGFAIPLYPQLRPLLEQMRQARGTAPSDKKVFRVPGEKRFDSAEANTRKVGSGQHFDLGGQTITEGPRHLPALRGRKILHLQFGGVSVGNHFQPASPPRGMDRSHAGIRRYWLLPPLDGATHAGAI